MSTLLRDIEGDVAAEEVAEAEEEKADEADAGDVESDGTGDEDPEAEAILKAVMTLDTSGDEKVSE